MDAMQHVKRVIIKIGTNTVLTNGTAFNFKLFNSLSYEIKSFLQQGLDIILVSSGSIGLGNGILRTPRSKDIVQSQCAAAVGQGALMNYYSQCFKSVDITVSQVLLTYDDIQNSTRNKNISLMLDHMLSAGIVPIINENDSVSTEEITFGDNDILSAMIANMVAADLLILLSNVDGVYECVTTKKRVKHLNIAEQTAHDLIDPTLSSLGKGGMASKFQAAKQAAQSNTMTVIANGNATRVLTQILSGEDIGTRLTVN